MLPLSPEFTPLIAAATEIIALGLFVGVAAVVLGRLVDEIVSELLMVISLLMVICVMGYMLLGLVGLLLPAPDLATRAAKAQGWATAGLVIAAIAVAGLEALTGRDLGSSEPGKRRGTIFFPGLWIGFCLASWIGHTAGGLVGLLTITVPAVMIFCLCLHYFARFILPLDEDQPVSLAFRCLLSFSTGANYPFYVLEGREKVERVPGSQFGQFFAGPGIFLTGPDHVVVASTGLKFTGVRGPGVVFTQRYEVIQEPVDLRPQQRAYTVEATTKDGIPVKFNTFGPFQLDAGEQQPELGKPFPFRASSIFKAFHAQPVDIIRDERDGAVVEERTRRGWDELYEMIGTHVMQDVIAECKFDELCEPLDLDKDPRVEIVEKYRTRMRQELAQYGIKILGGGISNLLPADDAVFNRRVLNWQAQWQRKMLERLGVAEAEAEGIIGKARAEVQAGVIQDISEAIAEVASGDKELIMHTVTLRFIESLNQMAEQPQLGEHLPPSVARIMGALPRIIGEE